MTTYYVRRSETGQATHNLDKLVTRMSTPKRLDALKSAADSAIAHPGLYYYVYNDRNVRLAKFHVEVED